MSADRKGEELSKTEQNQNSVLRYLWSDDGEANLNVQFAFLWSENEKNISFKKFSDILHVNKIWMTIVAHYCCLDHMLFYCTVYCRPGALGFSQADFLFITLSFLILFIGLNCSNHSFGESHVSFVNY